ncbi:hypothetical protein PIB30_025081 [Stylosanthes scabra]|uniref:GRF-type domain-containing protein n=1 Tax=Stylosanthes scabra TaxID=79078 RepID=A0ABU6U985_9FABA|nr:hypothetical protein [Stylosanthes scabra]
MGSSRERWSSSNCRGGGNNEGWSAALSSFGSAGIGALKKRSKFVAPECNCGAFAILFMSSTLGNPNRPFYGCPYFKTPAPHCKFFAWLDEYVASSDQEVNKTALYGRGKRMEGQQTGSAEFDVKVKELEDRVVGLEMKLRNTKHAKSVSGYMRTWLLLVAFVFGILIGHVIRALG